VEKTIGIAFLRTRYPDPDPYTWPPKHGQIIENPSKWGDMTSTGYNWVPEFPTLASTLLVFIVLAIVIAIRKRRLLKTPIH
jgi:hypothetical protein